MRCLCISSVPHRLRYRGWKRERERKTELCSIRITTVDRLVAGIEGCSARGNVCQVAILIYASMCGCLEEQGRNDLSLVSAWILYLMLFARTTLRPVCEYILSSFSCAMLFDYFPSFYHLSESKQRQILNTVQSSDLNFSGYPFRLYIYRKVNKPHKSQCPTESL